MKNCHFREITIWCSALKLAHHFGTFGGHFDLKLDKHVHFVIHSIHSDFGEVLKISIFAIFQLLLQTSTALKLRGNIVSL